MNSQSRCQRCNLQAHSGGQLCRAQRYQIPMRMRNTELAFQKVEISASYSNAEIRSAIKKSYNSKVRWWIRASRFSKLTHNLFEKISGSDYDILLDPHTNRDAEAIISAYEKDRLRFTLYVSEDIHWPRVWWSATGCFAVAIAAGCPYLFFEATNPATQNVLAFVAIIVSMAMAFLFTLGFRTLGELA